MNAGNGGTSACTIIAEIEDCAQALYRAVGVLRRRGRGIRVVVGPSGVPGTNHLTVTVPASEAAWVVRQLNRLTEVSMVRSESDTPLAQREADAGDGARCQADGVL